MKLLAKILATRLEKVLPTVISGDQTGSIKERHLFFNLWHLLNIISSYSSNSHSPEVLISLDAEKAFDRVEWDFLFATLSKFGFGTKFIAWIRLLHATPLASVHKNTFRSEHFPLKHSTRQGCPPACNISTCLRYLRRKRKFFGWHAGSLQAPVIANHLFAPSLSDTKFCEWLNKGIHSFRDLFVEDKFPSFQQLQTKFDFFTTLASF